jgi:hypothetical protein
LCTISIFPETVLSALSIFPRPPIYSIFQIVSKKLDSGTRIFDSFILKRALAIGESQHRQDVKVETGKVMQAVKAEVPSKSGDTPTTALILKHDSNLKNHNI